MTRRQLHLCSGALFLRSALIFFVARELSVWRRLRRLRNRPRLRLWVFLFGKGATPRSVLYAFLFAALAALLLDLLVRLVIRPMVRHWHTPRTDGSAGLFHLAANERVVESSPTRRKSGRLWAAGTLVLTNLRIWFFPQAHDAEIWSLPLDEVGDVHLEPEPRIAWGMIAGWPRRLAIREENGDGVGETFAVANPEVVLAWFAPARTSDTDEPSISTPRS